MKREPKYGDEVAVPSQHPDGHWVNGIVNSGHGGQPHRAGQLLIAAPGHRYSNVILVPVDSYGQQWAWPEDKGMTLTGSKRAYIDELEG
jgi:hypothetical protein